MNVTSLSTGTKLRSGFCVRCAYNTKAAPQFGPVTKALTGQGIYEHRVQNQ